MTQKPDFFALGGGLDLVTPAIVTQSGRARSAVNHEPDPKGYRRIDGYERFDGRGKPSGATYWVLHFTDGTASITAGQTVTGATSGAMGKALINAVVSGGTLGAGNAVGYLVLTDVTGTFDDGEALKVATVTKCIADGSATERGATNDDDDTTWLRSAIEAARTLIQQVPGSGAIRGVWVFKGITYAVRDNAGATAGVLHKSTATGWIPCVLGRSLPFTSGGRVQLPFTSGGLLHLAFTSGGTTPVTVGNTITGAISAATGTVSGVTLTSGSWAGGDAAGTFTLSAQSGTFVSENLNVGAALNLATIASNSTATPIQVADMIAGGTSAATGNVETVTITSGAWANGNAAGTLTLSIQTGAFLAESLNVGASLDVATVAGNSTSTAIAEGDTITGAASAASATVTRVILESGDWSTGDAAGRLIFTSQIGTFIAENLNVGAVTNLASIAANSSANALPAGGRYEFVNHNFYGASNLERMYGCNGVGPAFEWDGTTFVSIITGMADDTPKHIAEHKKHLFLGFTGGSAQHSGPGEPLVWNVVLGAGELGLGEEITGFLSSVSGVLAIFGRNKISMLYGDDAANWDLKPLSSEAGAVEWTAQVLGCPVYLDDRGLRSLTSTQTYGDFRMGTMSALVEPVFKQKRARSITAVASVRLRTKDQYRLFWSDGTALAMYVGRKTPEIMPLDYNGLVVRCVCAGEDANGQEIAFIGSDDGYVYQLDSGTSFDGGQVDAYIRLPFNHVGSPRQNKRWHKVSLELEAAPSTSIGITAEFSYAEPGQPAVREETFIVSGGGGFWNEANWDEFYWSVPAEGVADAPIDGIGTNISIVVASSSTYEEPYTLHGMTLYHSPRSLAR